MDAKCGKRRLRVAVLEPLSDKTLPSRLHKWRAEIKAQWPVEELIRGLRPLMMEMLVAAHDALQFFGDHARGDPCPSDNQAVLGTRQQGCATAMFPLLRSATVMGLIPSDRPRTFALTDGVLPGLDEGFRSDRPDHTD
jgi:hypothetical protein